jgi:exodeoxyribonuclease (lambda-induced)
MKIHNLQQGSIEWLQFRLGKVTSTRLKKVLSKDNLPVVDELIAEEECGLPDDDDFLSEDMQRGIDLEPLAIEAYSQATGNSVTRYGILQSDTIPMLCQSPDGYIGSVGAIEVKCPKTKNHIKNIRQAKLPNEYKEQVWCYFMVNPELEWLDFVSYDPRLTKKPLFIYRVNRADIADEISHATAELVKFIDKYNKYKQDLFF